MASISSAGIGSGLDVNGIVKQLMAVEQQPLTVLDQKEAGLQARLSAFGVLKGSVSALQSAVLSLKSSSLYTQLTAKPADSTIYSASAVSTANAGIYSVQVVDLAQAQSLSSQAFASMTTDVSATDGKLKIELGTFSGGVFTADSDKTPVTIDVAATGSSLSEIRDKINEANAGVRANIVNVSGDGSYKLTITSLETGAASSLRITALDSSDVPLAKDNTGLAKFYFDPAAASGSGKEFDVNVAAQDAHIKVDNLDIYRTSNTITDAITGVTLTLAKQGTSTLTVANDTASVRSAVDNFVKAYNDAAKQVKDLTAYNAETRQSSVLTGDSGARSLQSALRSMVTASVSISPTSSIKSLSDIGISMQRDGTLSVDSAKLESALAASPSDVATLFSSDTASTKGVAVQMYSSLTSILGTKGLLASRTDGINSMIDSLGDRREVLERRLIQIEKRYRTQFAALDSLVAGMQRTSQYLEQQLSKLPSTAQ